MLNSDESWVMSSTGLSWFVLVSQINLSVGKRGDEEAIGRGSRGEDVVANFFFFLSTDGKYQLQTSIDQSTQLDSPAHRGPLSLNQFSHPRGTWCGFGTIDGIVLSPQSPVVRSGHVVGEGWQKSFYISRDEPPHNDILSNFNPTICRSSSCPIQQAIPQCYMYASVFHIKLV